MEAVKLETMHGPAADPNIMSNLMVAQVLLLLLLLTQLLLLLPIGGATSLPPSPSRLGQNRVTVKKNTELP